MKIRLNFFLALLLALAGAATTSILLGVEWEATGIAIFVSTLAVAKFEFVHMQMVGHGTYVKKVKKVGRLPLFTGIFFILVAGLCLTMLYGTTQATDLLPQTVANFQSFALAGIVGSVVALLRWYFGAYYETFYGSQYEAMQLYLAQGLTLEEAQVKVRRLEAIPLEGSTSVGADGKFHSANVFGQENPEI